MPWPEKIFERRGSRGDLRSSLGSYTLVLLISMLVAFSLLTAVMSTTISGSLNNQRLMQLEEASLTLSESLADLDLHPQDLYDDALQNTAISVAGDLTGAYVWVVSPQGEIVYASDIPDYLRHELSYSTVSGLPVLSPELTGVELSDEGARYPGGNYMNLFENGSGEWISIVKPLFNSHSERFAYLHMHVGVDILRDARTYLIGGLGVTVLISLMFALVFAWTFGRRLITPLSQLSEAAEQIAMGNLDVRVTPQPTLFSFFSDRSHEPNELDRLYETFNQMVKALENQSQEQQVFIASISHDLRTPITSIHGFVKAMMDGLIPESQYPKYLAVVARESKRLANLVSEMNTVALMDGKAMVYTMRPFVVYDLIKETVQGLEGQIKEKRLTLENNFDTPRRRTYQAVGDVDQLRKVFYNLISNAVKFTPEGGTIRLTIHSFRRELIEVNIENSGTPIDPEDLPHIFDRFYKSDKSRTGHSGSGLGLYITRAVLREHGRTIEAGRSATLGGARFTFTLKRP